MRGALRPLERPHRQHVLKPGRRAGRQRIPAPRPVGLLEFQEEPQVNTFGYAGGLTPVDWLEGPGTVVFTDMRQLPALIEEAPQPGLDPANSTNSLISGG
jgi:hypothetical protein